MLNIIFLGAPGSGKGTQASILSQEISIPAISTGDILRSEVKNESEIGLLAKKYMDSGSLVPDEVVIGIIKKRILEKDCDNGFILDGFPRNINQAISLDKNLQEINKSISSVVMIDVPDDAIVKELQEGFLVKIVQHYIINSLIILKKKGFVIIVVQLNLLVDLMIMRRLL